MATKTKSKKVDMLKMKLIFNDIFMRETGLDIDDNDHIYNMETDCALAINEKFLKYCDYENPILRHDEIDFNLFENPKLCETLAFVWLKDHINNEIVSVDQCMLPDSSYGQFVMCYIKKGETLSIKSDPFVNESVRVLNLIAKILKRDHLYDFNSMDIKIEKKK